MIFNWDEDALNPAFVTPWSLVHITVGATSRGYVSWYTGQFLHIAYELIGSNLVFSKLGFKKYGIPDSDLNSWGDHLSFTFGQSIPRGPWGWATVGLFAAFTYFEIEM